MAIALDQSREIFILGAGFSKSISAAMPLTDGLGAALAAEDPVTFSTLGDGSFETWLSHRAEAQPYLARARYGAARLGALVRAMGEASRMERAISAAEAEDVDLRDVVRG